MATHGDRHPTDMAGLRGARIVTSIETEQGSRWAESKLKALTGGDKITARFMRQDFFEFTPQFKLLIVGNHKPSIRNVDEAMKRRLHMVPFTVTIPRAKRDKRLPDRLLAERDGILAWALQGCLEWQRTGLRPPAAVMAATEDYFEAEDAIGRWIDERCVRARSTREGSTALFARLEGVGGGERRVRRLDEALLRDPEQPRVPEADTPRRPADSAASRLKDSNSDLFAGELRNAKEINGSDGCDGSYPYQPSRARIRARVALIGENPQHPSQSSCPTAEPVDEWLAERCFSIRMRPADGSLFADWASWAWARGRVRRLGEGLRPRARTPTGFRKRARTRRKTARFIGLALRSDRCVGDPPLGAGDRRRHPRSARRRPGARDGCRGCSAARPTAARRGHGGDRRALVADPRRPVTPAQVTLCMIDLKLARLVHDPSYRDGAVDVIGYAALLPEVLG